MPFINEKLRSIGIEIPEYQPLPDHAPMVTHTRVGDCLYLSGHISDIPGEDPFRGQLGGTVSLEEGRQAARAVARNLLATLQHALGDLDRVDSIVKLLGMVSSTSDFTDQPAVINAASEVFVETWGPAKGKHTRSAVGVAQLPFGVPVEIELVVKVGAAE